MPLTDSIDQKIESMKVKPSNIPISAVEPVICYVLGCHDAISWLKNEMEKPPPPTSQQAPQIHGLEETVLHQLDMIARHTECLRVKANEVSGYPVLTNFLEDFVRIAPQNFQIELNFTICETRNPGPNYTTDAAIGLFEVIGASMSEPHISVTALRMCVCMLVCLRLYTVNFK